MTPHHYKGGVMNPKTEAAANRVLEAVSKIGKEITDVDERIVLGTMILALIGSNLPPEEVETYISDVSGTIRDKIPFFREKLVDVVRGNGTTH